MTGVPRRLDPTSSPVLQVDGVSFAYGERDAVDEITFGCPIGVTALLGPNGAGKTTLLRLVATARSPRDGTITITTDGDVHTAGSRGALRRYRRRFGWLPQGFQAPGGFTTSEVVAYAGWLKGLSSQEATRRSRSALGRVGLADRADDKVRRLSGGMLQRLGIAQAVVHEPPVLLLDEPTVGLDPDQRASFRALLRELGASAAVLVSTHLTEDVELMCDRVVVLSEGRVRFDAGLDRFLGAGGADVPTGVSRGEHAYRATLGRAG